MRLTRHTNKAQRMCRKILLIFLLQVYATHVVYCGVITAPSYEDHNEQENEIEEKPSHTWLKSAQNIIASPAGHVVVQVAKELLNRSAGNSQVLSLNLTNLLIIILLKMLIFAAAMLGAGHWTNYGYSFARSSDGGMGGYDFGLNPGESYLITGFLAAQGSGVDACLYAAACANPNVGYEYAKAARALLEGIEKFAEYPLDKARYNDLIVLVEKAAYDGYRGEPCNTAAKCDGLL